MSYITISIPNDTSIIETAKIISRSLDPDVGGEFAFNSLAIDENNIEYAVYGTPCTDQFYASVEYFKSNPLELTESVNNDIDTRWQNEPHIVVDDVIKFCDGVQMSSAYGILAGLTELGLTINIKNE